MSGPWEKYKSAGQPQGGPWEKYKPAGQQGGPWEKYKSAGQPQGGPWEKYKSAGQQGGPWEKYKSGIKPATPVPPESFGQKLEGIGKGIYEGGKNILKEVPAGIVEGGLGMATGALAYPISLMGEAGALAITHNPSKAQDFGNFLQDYYTYHPQSEAGKNVMKIAGAGGSVGMFPSSLVQKGATAIGGPMTGEVIGLPARALNMIALGDMGDTMDKVGEAGRWTMGKVGKAGRWTGGKVGKAGRWTIDKVTHATEPLIDDDTLIDKTIRPDFSQNKTASQRAFYHRMAKGAIQSIIDSKNSLVLTDPTTGAIREGQLPETIDQFAEAISQVKVDLFNQYNMNAQAAEGAGRLVDLSSVKPELLKIINSKRLQNLHADIVKYAKAKLSGLNALGYKLGPLDTQEEIATLNNELRAFDRNPQYKEAGMASIDNLLRNIYRRSLDKMVKNLGAEYASLKQQYGALSHIETDVNRRALVHSRSNPQGLFGATDVFSGEIVLRGIMTGNPVDIAAGTGMRFIRGVKGWKNNPDHLTREVFRRAENASDPMPEKDWSEALKPDTTAIPPTYPEKEK